MMPKQSNSSAKKEIEFAQSLKLSSDEQVISLLEELRESGDIFTVRPLLNELFSARSEKLKFSLLEFITDIKNQAVVPVIVECIRGNYHHSEVGNLVSTCWQSRLDFSEHLSIFIDILFQKDYQTAFEAFTVIENTLDFMDPSAIKATIKIIKARKNEISVEKQELINELLNTLDNFSRETKE